MRAGTGVSVPGLNLRPSFGRHVSPQRDRQQPASVKNITRMPSVASKVLSLVWLLTAREDAASSQN